MTSPYYSLRHLKIKIMLINKAKQAMRHPKANMAQHPTINIHNNMVINSNNSLNNILISLIPNITEHFHSNVLLRIHGMIRSDFLRDTHKIMGHKIIITKIMGKILLEMDIMETQIPSKSISSNSSLFSQPLFLLSHM